MISNEKLNESLESKVKKFWDNFNLSKQSKYKKYLTDLTVLISSGLDLDESHMNLLVFIKKFNISEGVNSELHNMLNRLIEYAPPNPDSNPDVDDTDPDVDDTNPPQDGGDEDGGDEDGDGVVNIDVNINLFDNDVNEDSELATYQNSPDTDNYDKLISKVASAFKVSSKSENIKKLIDKYIKVGGKDGKIESKDGRKGDAANAVDELIGTDFGVFFEIASKIGTIADGTKALANSSRKILAKVGGKPGKYNKNIRIPWGNKSTDEQPIDDPIDDTEESEVETES